MIDDITQWMIDALRLKLSVLTGDQRVEVFDAIEKDYCRSCGNDDLPCYCENDD